MTLTTNDLELIVEMLRDLEDKLENNGCNDFEFPFRWGCDEKAQFIDEVYDRYPDEDKPDNGCLEIPEYVVVKHVRNKIEHQIAKSYISDCAKTLSLNTIRKKSVKTQPFLPLRDPIEYITPATSMPEGNLVDYAMNRKTDHNKQHWNPTQQDLNDLTDHAAKKYEERKNANERKETDI